MNRNVIAAGVFHTAQHQHLGPARGQLEHFLERDGVQPLGVGHDARVGGEDAVDIGVDLADVGVQRGSQRDGGGVRPAAAQRRDVLAVLADPLEAGDQHDQLLVERLPQPAGGDVDDLGVAVGAGGDHTGLRPGERPGLGTERVDGHRDQRVGDPLTRGQQHVHFPRRRGRADLSGQVEQVVGGVAHGGDHHDDVVALLLGLHDALGDAADPLGVRYRGSAVLLHDERHCQTFRVLCEDPTKDKGFAHLIYSAGSVRMWSRTPPMRRRGTHPGADPSAPRRAVEPADVRPRRGVGRRAAGRRPGGRTLGRDVGAPPTGAVHRRAARRRDLHQITELLKRGNRYAHAAGALIMVCIDEGEDDRTARYAAVDAGAAIAQLTHRSGIARAGRTPDGGVQRRRRTRGVRNSGGRTPVAVVASVRSATTRMRHPRSSSATRRAANGCRWKRSCSPAGGVNRFSCRGVSAGFWPGPACA